MIYSLVVIILVVILLIYFSLNHKIQKLENEISELNKKILNKNSELSPVREKPATTPLPSIQNINPARPTEREIQTEEQGFQQKDWLGPITDFLKQNALTIIGIFTLVLGIGYFVKYAIDKNWIGETARVGIGLCTGVGIILIGHFLRKNYSVFSSIITGGGIAVLYFSMTIAFREYHLFAQNTAFLVICLITLISILLSYYYNSQILTIFSLFGGFLAPLMISTGHSNYLFLFTYLSILNMGMLVIVFLKHWKNIGWIAFIFTNIYLFYWVIEKPEILSVYFFMITYLVFYAFALQDYFKKNTLSIIDILMLVFTNFTSVIGLVSVFNELKYEPVIIFPVVFAIANALLLYRQYGRKSFGTSYSVFAGITVSLITIAFAIQFKTNLITSVWAIEATLLLFIWKRTGFNIFKICFYVLFPLVILVQTITWTEYITTEKLNIIINPVFLTSSVTIITTLTNLFLLRKPHGTSKPETTFFENLLRILSYGLIYLALLLEILYHISGKHISVIISIALLFSIYYLFILLLFRKRLNINKELIVGFIYIFIFSVIIHTSLSASLVTDAILEKKLSKNFYGINLLYLIPFAYLQWRIFSTTNFFKNTIAYWFISLALILVTSFELFHWYILGNAGNIDQVYPLREHFSILYLPIIWAVLASIFIYTGLKRDIPEFNKIGFVLIGIMIVKLYVHDVWQMDNVSRIIAFIILGIILLLSSFLFQRLKNIIKNLVERKDENDENKNKES